MDDAANYKKLYVEVQRDLPLEKTIALLQYELVLLNEKCLIQLIGN